MPAQQVQQSHQQPADDRFAYLKKRSNPVSQNNNGWQNQTNWTTPTQQQDSSQGNYQQPLPVQNNIVNAPPVMPQPFVASKKQNQIQPSAEYQLGMVGDELREIDWSQDFDDNTWHPNADAPYPPAINSRTEILIKITRFPGTRKARVRYVVGKPEDYNVTEEEMNRNQHYVTSTTLRLNEFTPKSKPTDINALGKEDNSPHVPANDKMINQEMIEESMFDGEPGNMPPVMSVREAVIMCNYTHKAININDSSLTSTRVSSAVQKFFFGQEDHSATLLALGKTHSFQHLCNEMTKITSNKDSSKELLSVVTVLDNYLKNKLLRVLRYKLGITDLSFDSFVDDAPLIFSYLKDNYGESYSKALYDNQKEFILTYLAPTDSARFEEMGNDENVHENVIKAGGIQEAITVTCIGLSSAQLNVATKQNMASLVSEASLPQLHNFIALTTDITIDPDDHFGSHYLLTNDDRLFELHKGYLSTEAFPSYLIHEVVLD